MAKEKQQVYRALAAEIQNAQEQQDEAIENLRPEVLLEDAWELYLKSGERNDPSPRTLKMYSAHWNGFRNWLQTCHPEIRLLRLVTKGMAKAYGNFMERELERSSGTINKNRDFLRAMYTALRADEYHLGPENPFDGLKRRKPRSESRRSLSQDELQRILETADGELRTLLLIGIYTGLRFGDACTLRWREVDLKRGIIRRVQNKTARHHPDKVLPIGIPQPLHHELSNLSASGEYVLPDMSKRYNDNRAAAITRKIQKHFAACGIRIHREARRAKGTRASVEVGFHSLRHTFVTLHAEVGTPTALLEKIVGHRLKILKEAAEVINKVVAVERKLTKAETPEEEDDELEWM